jgi:hypothetical protein
LISSTIIIISSTAERSIDSRDPESTFVVIDSRDPESTFVVIDSRDPEGTFVVVTAE